jgi:competence protein ComEC
MSQADAPNPERAEEVPRHRPLIPVLAGFAAGIALDGVLELPPGSWCVLAFGALGLALWAVVRGLKPWGNWALAVLVLLPIGGAWHMVRFRQRPPDHLSRILGPREQLLYVRGTVAREPESRCSELLCGGGTQQWWLLRVEVESLSADGKRWVQARGGLSVRGEGEPAGVRVGDEVELLAGVRGNRGPTNPGETDFGLILARGGTFGSAKVSSAEGIRVLRQARWYGSLPAAVGRLRALLKDRLIWSGDRAVDPVTASLIFGEQGGLCGDHLARLAEGGCLHFLAISGLNVGIFAAFAWMILLRVRMPVPSRSATLIGLVWLYVLFTGAQVSACRAGWMVSFLAAAPLLRRRWDSISSLAGAALLVLVWHPQELFTVGFQFSFVAVWTLIYPCEQVCRIIWPWGPLLERLEQPSERSFLQALKGYAGQFLVLCLCISVAVAPLTAYHFHRFSLWTPVINALLWPLVLALTLAAFLLAPSALIGAGVAAPLVWISHLLSIGIEKLLELFVGLPGFVIYTAGPPVWWVVAFYVVLCVWVVRLRMPKATRIFVTGVAALGASYFLWGVLAFGEDRPIVTVADVGRGQCIVFRTPSGSAMIYDAGGFSVSRADAVAGILRRGRVHCIEVLAVSHRDCDHCSFVPYLAHRFRVDRLVIPPLGVGEEKGGVDGLLRDAAPRRMLLLEGGLVVGTAFECRALHPDDRFMAEPKVDDNDRSLVLMCDYGGWRFLLTGDVGEPALRRLVAQYGDKLRADVLVLPHHGHWAPGLRELVEAVRPQAAIASCQEDDVAEGTRRALDELGVPLWTTVQEGAVIIKLGERAAELYGYASGRRQSLALRSDAVPVPADVPGGRQP